MSNHTAMFWTADNGGKVNCTLCPHNCKISLDSTGLCGVRKNIGGTLYAESYGKITSLALDPIEKKPLYHFEPGSKIVSVGSYGCNLKCGFCQNYEIAHKQAEYKYCPPEFWVQNAQRIPKVYNNIGVAFTYNEPTIGYEYILDCAKLLKENGQKVVLVTNGYLNRQPLENLLPYIDAMNIDLKGFTDEFYRKLGGKLEPVKETIALSQKHCHVEITTLIIPNENDSDGEIAQLSQWIASLNPNISLHLSRFFPNYKYSDNKETPESTMFRLAKIAGQYLNNVFLGNM